MDGGLDAKARRELDALRRRAYGPDADILSDPAALARLRTLEGRAHAGAPVPLPDTPAPRVAPGSSRVPSEPSARAGRPARAGWHVGLIAGCGVAALALSAFAAIAAVRTAAEPDMPAAAAPPRDVRAFTQAASTRLVARLPLEGTLRGVIPSPAADEVPDFPTDVPVLWVDPLGQYFGVRVWIARTVDGGSCVLVEVEERSHATCVDVETFESSALLVTVPFDELADGTRPSRMVPEESFGVWWRPDRPIELLIGPAPRG